MKNSTTRPTYEEIKARIAGYALKLNITDDRLPSLGSAFGEGLNIAIAVDGSIYLEFWERGCRTSMEVAIDVEDLCYRLFKVYVEETSYKKLFEGSAEDQVRARYKQQEELIVQVNPEWKPKLSQTHYWDLRRRGYEK